MNTERVFVGVRIVIGLLLIAALLWLLVSAASAIWQAFTTINSDLAVALVMGAATVFAAVMTVMLGRYYERKKEIEAHFRTEKIQIYDEFLKEFFKVMHNADEGASENPDELVHFLREWQRKLVLWGGSSVLKTYFAWMGNVKTRSPNVQTFLLMDEFFRALRTDIGQDSNGLVKGSFAKLILRHGDFFLAAAKRDPSMSLSELSRLEKIAFGEDESESE